jgi:hypothetical protein
MSDVPGFSLQREALDEMAAALHGQLSEGDECIFYMVSWMGPFAQARCWAVRHDGRFESPLGPANSIRGPRGGFGRAERRLREACYQEGKGTWFGLELTVTSDGEVTARYNYDADPEWTRPIEPTIYVQEQEKYPRDLEHQPEWFRRRLVEGRVALEEWQRAQGR